MSKTLKLADRLLERGRNCHSAGRHHEAIEVLSRLTSPVSFAENIIEEAEARLGEIQLQRHQFAQARHHLHAAIEQNPDNGRYYHLLGKAWLYGDDADPELAFDNFQFACVVEPNNPEYLADLGLIAVELGYTKQGLQALAEASELAPDDPYVLSKHTDALLSLDRIERARQLLLAARFRNPHHHAIAKLWSDFQFDQLALKQQRANRLRSSGKSDCRQDWVLPFVPRPTTKKQRAQVQKIIRKDGPSLPRPPRKPQNAVGRDCQPS